MSHLHLSTNLWFCVCPGRSAGSGRSAGAEENWPTAPGRFRLSAHWDGLLQDEGGKEESGQQGATVTVENSFNFI